MLMGENCSSSNPAIDVEKKLLLAELNFLNRSALPVPVTESVRRVRYGDILPNTNVGYFTDIDFSQHGITLSPFTLSSEVNVTERFSPRKSVRELHPGFLILGKDHSVRRIINGIESDTFVSEDIGYLQWLNSLIRDRRLFDPQAYSNVRNFILNQPPSNQSDFFDRFK